MARGGINKALVKSARERLIAKGEHPTIDGIRIELGNTGSKTTISNYLAQLNEESSVRSANKANLSDVLHELVAGMAAQLHREAEDIVEQARIANQTIIADLRSKNSGCELALKDASQHIGLLQTQLASSEQARNASDDQSSKLLLKIERLSQGLSEKESQIAAKDLHIESLEEKHRHARQALEHYRESVKEQRQQDQRNHETQVQQLQAEIRQLNQTISIKQTDVTHLNKDNSRLITELSETRKQLRIIEVQLQTSTTELKKREESAVGLSRSIADLEDTRISNIQRIAELQQQLEMLEQSSRSMHTELITTRTELTVKNQIFESLQLRAQ